MKNFKFYIVAFSAMILTLASCTDDLPERSASYAPATDVMGVYFPNSNDFSAEVSPSEVSYTVKISRVNAVHAAVVKLFEVADTSGMFTLPASVSFAVGQTDTSIEVGFGDLVDFVPYTLTLGIEVSKTNPYDTLIAGTSQFILTITQSDYVDFAEGTFESSFFEDSWEQVLQYSALLDQYRLTNLYSPGYNFSFSWSGVGSRVVIPEGESISDAWTATPTGYIDADYGMITSNISTNSEKTYYDAETQIFHFYTEFVDAEGSWGKMDETFEVSTFLTE